MPLVFLVLAALAFPHPAQAFSCAGGTPGLSSRFAAVECCLRLGWEKRYDCLERTLDTDTGATADLLAELETARSASETIETGCHAVAHAIGRRAVRLAGGDLGEAFGRCTSTCAFGCQHGIMERLLQENGIGADHPDRAQLARMMPAVCSAQALGSSAAGPLFQCLHGLGHALAFTLDYDLPGALGMCDLLGSAYDRDSCYSGALMENLVASDKDKRYVRADDPLFPCSALPDRYLGRCAQEQTRRFLELGWTDEQAADGCRTLGAYAGDCFLGLGRDVSPSYRTGDTQRLADLCQNLAGPEYGDMCVRGARGGLIDATDDGTLAFSYCARLEEPLRASCFTQAGTFLREYHGRPEALARADCAAAGAEREECEALALPRHDPLGRWLLGLLRGIFARFG
jgi:hypothetical protein